MLVRRLRLPALLAVVVLVASLFPSRSDAQTQRYSAIGHYFRETNQAVGGTFWDYWNTRGGLKQFGYPISQELAERSEVDGKTYVVQYFERAAFEYHPELRSPNNVQLQLLGSALYKQKYPSGAPNQQPNRSTGSVVFRETSKRLGGRFLQYWRANGGLQQYGYPVSDEFAERSAVDGKEYRVQYFQRAVLEYHPENRSPNDVLLTQVGTLRYYAKYSVTNGRAGDMDSDGVQEANNGDLCPRIPENNNKVFDGDGCPDTMQTLLIFAAEDINAFWEAEFKASRVRYDPPADFVAYNRVIRTECGPAVLNNAFYCGPAHGIYYHYDFLLEQLETDGDFAPVTIMAHEWGHLVQANLGLLGGQFYSKQTELQADCFAGAWAAHAGEEGYLEEGDLDEGATSLFKAGDDINTPWFDPGAHGQPEERIAAFQVGLQQGVAGCFQE